MLICGSQSFQKKVSGLYLTTLKYSSTHFLFTFNLGLKLEFELGFGLV